MWLHPGSLVENVHAAVELRRIETDNEMKVSNALGDPGIDSLNRQCGNV